MEDSNEIDVGREPRKENLFTPTEVTGNPDLQKKILRAERFGLPVQLSEEEKRNSRAQRFGTAAPALKDSDEARKSDEQKKKARAERFGLPSCSAVDEEARKKARLARFSQVPKTDSLEEDKRKARTARFSQTSLGTPSQTSGDTNSVLKPIIVDKTQ